jgi:lambda repressor-like predicted transcriptional regulator
MRKTIAQLPGDAAIPTDAYQNGSIAEALKRLMQERGVGVRELARATGISRGAIDAWTRFEAEPRWAAVQAIADAFGVSTEELRPIGRVPSATPTERPVGPILGDLMRGRGIGVRELSQATGLMEIRLTSWLRGEAEPPGWAIFILADAIGVHPEELMPSPTHPKHGLKIHQAPTPTAPDLYPDPAPARPALKLVGT